MNSAFRFLCETTRLESSCPAEDNDSALVDSSNNVQLRQSKSIEAESHHILAAPFNHGLLITLVAASDEASGKITPNMTCRMQFCSDVHLRSIHPHVYAPSALERIKSLPGSGSGAAVFGGHHPELGPVVMKHGDEKDLRELLALATIGQELQTRAKTNGAQNAARFLRDRIPEFRMLYVSPKHLVQEGKTEQEQNERDGLKDFVQTFCASNETTPTTQYRCDPRQIRICSGKNERCLSVQMSHHGLDFCVRSTTAAPSPEAAFVTCGDPGTGYESLKAVVDKLVRLQKKYQWKFTLGQKRVGGSRPKTASCVLSSGNMKGSMLDTLVNQFLRVIRDLQTLTTMEEAIVHDKVLDQLQKLEEKSEFNDASFTALHVSKLLDTFCGRSILKNWHPRHGRFQKLLELGAQFREIDCLHLLSKQEHVPARLLGKLLCQGSRITSVYSESVVSLPNTTFNLDMGMWRFVLKHAIQQVHCLAAITRVWTCGLSDAGLQNLFLGPNQLWLYDLGEPSLQAIPGFLTKFLFSFFHTLGMEEDGNGGWVNRFVISNDKLELSEATMDLLPQAHHAFEVTLDRLMDELFCNEENVRQLLVQYVTLQLLSDCAFCLEKWVSLKQSDNAKSDHERYYVVRWLWRALWDIYVAHDISTKYWKCDNAEYSLFRQPNNAATE